MRKPKYVVDYISGVASRIAIPTKTPGYTIGILEPFYPSDEELAVWSGPEHKKWIKENNERMEAICEFLNNREK